MGKENNIRLKIQLIILMIILISCYQFKLSYVYASEVPDNVITINVEQEKGEINKKVFGNNFQGIDPVFTGKWWVDWVINRAAYGAGVWDPDGEKPVQEVMDLAEGAGMSIVRYAMGKYKLDNIIDMYDSDGIIIERSVKYGLDQFIETINEIGAEPVIIIPIHPDVVGDEVNDFSKRAQHAADIVEYLNYPSDGENTNPNGGEDWAEIRAMNGHVDPYNVRFFEIGNEPYVRPNVNGVPQAGGSGVDFGWGYGNLFYAVSGAMKVVDPSVRTGLSLIALMKDQRNINILSNVDGNNLDYVVLHMYFNQESNMDDGMDSEDAFLLNLSRPTLIYDVLLKKFRTLIGEYTGKEDVPIAISEYNCWHSDSCHEQLAGAIVNAEAISVFMKHENNVLMANHWGFTNGLYGMIQTKNHVAHDYQESIFYKKRPVYYVFEMYNRYFGDILIDSETIGETYDVQGYVSFINYLANNDIPINDTSFPYLSVNSSKSADGKKVHLMVINKHPLKDMTAAIYLNNFLPRSVGAWILNGDTVDANNEDNTNVDLTYNEMSSFANGDPISFNAHSVTALIFESEVASEGWYKNEWQYRQRITINRTLVETEIEGFPLLIKIADGGNAVFTGAQENGDDIVFTMNDGVTKLAHEIERYESSSGIEELVVWVSIPIMSSWKDTNIYMYYGSNAHYNLETPQEVWDNGYTMVQHLQEITGDHIDSTSNNNDYNEVVELTSQGDPTIGRIGAADRFAKNSERITEGNTLNNLFKNNVGIIEVWMKPAGNPLFRDDIYKLPAVIADDEGKMGIFRGEFDSDGDGVKENKIWILNSSIQDCLIGIDYQVNEWSHIVWHKSASVLSVYKNGEAYDSISCNENIGNGTGHLNIGRVHSRTLLGASFNGIIDEVRISNIDRSTGWIRTAYNNQYSPDTYLAFGAEEEVCSDGDGDGDGIDDCVDKCPVEDAAGFDADMDGCIDTLSRLSEIVKILSSEGSIAVRNQRHLLGRVANATKFAEKEKICATIKSLESFENMVNEKRNKGVAIAAANEIIAYTDSVITYFQSWLHEGESCEDQSLLTGE